MCVYTRACAGAKVKTERLKLKMEMWKLAFGFSPCWRLPSASDQRGINSVYATCDQSQFVLAMLL